MNLKNYQKRVKDWDLKTFGPKENYDDVVSLRVFEEAVELCQTYSQITKETLLKVIDQVYEKKVGEQSQEVAGILIALLNYSNHANINTQESYLKEMQRCENMSDVIREKNKLKLHKEDLK